MAKTKITDLGYCILGLLSRGPMTGYEVRKLFETTALGTYSSSPGSIYPAINKLTRLGLIESVLSPNPSTGRMRKAVALTESGREAFLDWLNFPDFSLHETGNRLPSLMLRFSFLEENQPTEEILTFLTAFQKALSIWKTSLEDQLETLLAAAPLSARLALQSGIMNVTTQQEWVQHALETYEKTARTS